MALTSPLSILLCLLLLGSLAPTPSQGRTLLDIPKDQAEQAAREQQQMQEQLATQQAWEAQQMAQIQAQQAAEEAKLREMAEEHAVREAQQMAQITAEAAEKAAREQAAAVEQAQLAAQAADAAAAAAQKAAEREARREARRAARRAEKEARKAAREAEAAAAAAAVTAQSVPEESGSDDGNRGGSGGGGSDGGGGSPYRGVTGPIWGMEVGQSDGLKGSPGPVYTTYHYYAPGYETSSLYCADAFAPLLPAKPDTPLLKHPWTAYCNIEGLGPMSQDKCGKCLRVTNPATGQWVVVQVVDMCGQGGIDMDPLGFNAIDGDGAGVRDGHMDTRIEWTQC